MAAPEDPAAALSRLLQGYRVTQAIHVAATLGIADLLADGRRTADELAAETGSHAPTLARLLRALASLGVLSEGDDGRFATTPVGDCLRTGVPGSLADFAAFVGRPYHWEAWSALVQSVRTGENAFRLVHGRDVWSYRAERPEESALFDRLMATLSAAATEAVLAAYDFGRFGRLVDVGGGTGTLLAAVLAAHPALEGVLFDQPHVVARAPAVLAEAGVADRCRIESGSFFDGVPAGADAYVLRSIVHDWGDAEAVAILRACRAAMADGGVVLLIERELGGPNEKPEAKLSDLNMLVGPGGRERSRDEYAALFGAAGLRLARVVPTAAGADVLEASPA
jgi:O-methyltransferase/methyltransferase family protein